MVIGEVQEMQGLYGPFTLTERVLQKIWLRQQFETHGLTTTSGRTLEVINPGKWNLLGGPDFKGATLRLGGEILSGDVEVHFNAADWYAHQHETNPEFDSVILHVLLHEERGRGCEVRTARGAIPESLVLLPLLDRDLESIAMDEALLELEQVNELEWVAGFLELPLEMRLERLEANARHRWRQKCQFAQKRLAVAGWDEACHQFCLEVLGYARNRAPMSALALQFSLEAMGGMDAAFLFDQQRQWRLSGLRPANHPGSRLEQYLEVLEVNPDWPAKVEHALRRLPDVSGGNCRALRKEASLSQWSAQVRKEVFGNQFGASRFHTLFVDALLPLAHVAGLSDLERYWLSWYVGDAPVSLLRFLKLVEATSRVRPRTNGLVQGALALFYNGGASV